MENSAMKNDSVTDADSGTDELASVVELENVLGKSDQQRSALVSLPEAKILSLTSKCYGRTICQTPARD